MHLFARCYHVAYHVCPNDWNARTRQSTAFIRDFYCNVLPFASWINGAKSQAWTENYLFSVCNHQLDGWVFILVVGAKSLHNSTQRVLEQLKHHMVQMRRHIHEFNVTGTKHLDFWGSKQSIMVLANESGIGNGILSNVLDVCPGTNDTDIISHKWATIQRWMLTYQHSNTNSGHVETIQKLLDVCINHTGLSVLLVFHDALCHGGHYWIVSSFDVFDGFDEWIRVRQYRRCAFDVFKVVVVSVSYCWIVFSGWFWLWNSEVGCALR